MAASTWHLLPPELIEHQIAQIDLLMAMYTEEEITMSDQSRTLFELFKNGIETNSLAAKSSSEAPTLNIMLNLLASEDKTLHLDMTVPFTYAGEEAPDEAPSIKVRIRQPSWLNRAATAELNSQISEQDDLFTIIDSIKEAAIELVNHIKCEKQAESNVAAKCGPLVRAWFYFPSISTRSKRDDLIIHAPSYSLTGFLFAGKPGLLCLEGTTLDIDAYMKFIKTESWGDIPSHHKKVSERLREADIERAFTDMQEITDEVGERRGTRANRGDMGAVEAWLEERGLKEALAKVLM